MRIILISGKAGSGKDFLAQRLADTLTKVFYAKVGILHFADPLKMVAKQLYGWDGEKGEHGRALLQRVGTNVIRAHNPSTWTSIIWSLVDGLRSEFDTIIIPDCRFPNEITDIKKWATESDRVYTVRISGKNDQTGTHASETALDDYEDFDYLFPNKDYDVDLFYFELNKLINSILWRTNYC